MSNPQTPDAPEDEPPFVPQTARYSNYGGGYQVYRWDIAEADAISHYLVDPAQESYSHAFKRLLQGLLKTLGLAKAFTGQ